MARIVGWVEMVFILISRTNTVKSLALKTVSDSRTHLQGLLFRRLS